MTAVPHASIEVSAGQRGWPVRAAAIWLAVALILVAVGYVTQGGVSLYTDSLQYLSVADNVFHGHFGYTSLVNYDAERSFGVVPAPIVTFPIGYPIVTALISLTGLSLTSAAFVTSVAGMAGTIVVLAWASRLIGMTKAVTHVVLAGYVVNATALHFASALLTESLFTFAVTLACVMIVRARRATHDATGWRWLAAGLVAGISYHVRYAGLFLVVGIAALAIFHLLRGRRGLARGYGLAFVAGGGAVLLGVARNLLLVADWRGGNTKAALNPVQDVLAETLGSVNQVVFGVQGFGEWRVLLPRTAVVLMAGSLAAWMTWAALRAWRSSALPERGWFGDVRDLAAIALTYLACMFYAGLVSVISYGARMFVPLIPLGVLIVVTSFWQLTMRERPRGTLPRWVMPAAGLTFVLYASLNVLSHALAHRIDAPAAIASRLESSDGAGPNVRTIVDDLAGNRGVILGNKGQVVGHLLGKRTVSLVEPVWSDTHWDEESVRSVLRRYQAAALVITRPETRADREELTDFLNELASGRAPAWARGVYFSRDFAIYAPAAAGWLVPEQHGDDVDAIAGSRRDGRLQ